MAPPLARETHSARPSRPPQGKKGPGALRTPRLAKDYGPRHRQQPQAAPGWAREASAAPGAQAARTHAPVPPRRGRGAPPRAAAVGSHLALGPGLPRYRPGTEGERAATCRCHLRRRSRPPGQGGQDRAGCPSRAGGGTRWAEGDPGHRGDDGSASFLSEGQSCAPRRDTRISPFPPSPRKRPGWGAEGRVASAAVTHRLRSAPAAPAQPAAAAAPGAHGCSAKGSRDPTRTSPSRLQGASASGPGATWEL